jgi:acyl-CoA thioesterase-1
MSVSIGGIRSQGEIGVVVAFRAPVLRRALSLTLLLLSGFVVLLAVELLWALNGPSLPRRLPLFLDRDFDGPSADRDEPISLVWLGDSTGAGVGASSVETALPTIVVRGLQRSVRLRVLAMSGARVKDVLTQQLPRVEALRPDVVIVGVGGNDVTHLTPRSLFEGLYDAMLQTIGSLHPATVVVIGIGDFGTVPRIPQPLRALTGWRGRWFDDSIRRVAHRRGAAYVDLYANTGPAFGHDPVLFYSEDGFHPSDEGYRIWADVILDVLRAQLRDRLPA